MKSQEDTVAVMVVYQPPEGVMRSIEALLPQVNSIIVIDNGRNDSLKRLLGEKVIWIQSPENNLAKAQNLGIAKAQEIGANFVLLMDDDSLPAPDMVKQLRAAWQEGIGVIAPALIEHTLGRKPPFIQACGKWWFRRVSIQHQALSNLFYVAASGSLIPLSVIQKIGNMDEDLGIYFVDTEFCLRARKAGLDIVTVATATMEHSFGNVTRHAGGITTTNHRAEARFQMFKNRKKLWRRYWQSDGGYVAFDILRSISEILRVMLLEEDKTKKLLAMLHGLAA
jgi:rhamnosyltransferase